MTDFGWMESTYDKIKMQGRTQPRTLMHTFAQEETQSGYRDLQLCLVFRQLLDRYIFSDLSGSTLSLSLEIHLLFQPYLSWRSSLQVGLLPSKFLPHLSCGVLLLPPLGAEL